MNETLKTPGQAVGVDALVGQNNIGDRVQILRKDMYLLKNRKRPLFGFITNTDGGYIYVRPAYCNWVIELYPNEIKPV